MTLSIVTLSISIMTLSIITLTIMTLSIITHNIMGLFAIHSINDILHNVTQYWVSLC